MTDRYAFSTAIVILPAVTTRFTQRLDLREHYLSVYPVLATQLRDRLKPLKWKINFNFSNYELIYYQHQLL